MFHDPYFSFGVMTKEQIINIMVFGTNGLTELIGMGRSIYISVSPYVCSYDPKVFGLA